MHLVQILLPLYTPNHTPFPKVYFIELKKELSETFGGLTAYNRSPADGMWKDEHEQTIREDIIVYEIMVDDLEKLWWKNFKKELVKKFQQQEIIIRASNIQLL